VFTPVSSVAALLLVLVTSFHPQSGGDKTRLREPRTNQCQASGVTCLFAAVPGCSVTCYEPLVARCVPGDCVLGFPVRPRCYCSDC
jgi:hypothetical protein